MALKAAEDGREPARPRGTSARSQPVWVDWPDERLLDLRLCDLGVTIPGSPVADCVEQLYRELAERHLRFRPHVWLSDDWYCPDGVPGIAVPFYMAHPRLAALELAQMLEVEGGTPEWCMRLLRHEAGHAVENAYRLRRRRARQRLFGKSSARYPQYYTPRPYSKRYVVHLDMWYAQSHPDEDFAETFAIWLTPGADWPERYAGWPARRKLEYVDSVMGALAGRPPLVTTRARVDPLSRLRKTLREHYAEKRRRYGVPLQRELYDRHLRRMFSDDPQFADRPSAVRFLRKIRREIRRQVAAWTGAYQYTIDQVLGDIIARCRELRLRVAKPEEQAKLDFTILLTVQTMNYLHTGRHRVAV